MNYWSRFKWITFQVGWIGLLTLALSAIVEFSLGVRYRRGYEAGRDSVISEAVKNGSAALCCSSETGEVEILWVTVKEDRERFRQVYRGSEGKGETDE